MNGCNVDIYDIGGDAKRTLAALDGFMKWDATWFRPHGYTDDEFEEFMDEIEDLYSQRLTAQQLLGQRMHHEQYDEDHHWLDAYVDVCESPGGPGY